MRPSSLRTLCAAVLAATGLQTAPLQAEDIDLFTNPNPGAATAPNILIVLDNSANWNANNQGWTDDLTGISPFKQGQSELRALRTLMDDPNINEGVNIGLFMFASGNPNDTGYPRFHIRNMTPANRAAFKEMIGPTTGCVNGPNSLNGTPNCLFKNFSSSSEQTNSASTRYSAALFEAFKYFGGYTDPARAKLDQPGTPVDSTHFGNQRYGTLSANTDSAAWADAGKTRWASPLDSLGNANCAKNYIIFIGNGYPSQDVADSLLTGINGNATVPAGVGNKNWKVANWAKYMLTTDVNAAPGQQNIATYTIDVFKNQQDANQTALMKAMAKHGGGKYFEAKNEQAIINALRDIITEIQAVNTVFASASLPINATNRSQNENQVFIGMFRPDGDANPRWYGNLKQYQIALFGTEAKLADKNGVEAIAATTGFLQPCATSFWTTDSGAYWSFSAPSAGTCTSVANSSNSDLPDGSIVEKGGAAEVLRKGNNPAAAAPYTVARTMYTCNSAPCTAGGLVAFSTTSVTMARTGAANAAQNMSIVDYTIGKDVNDENGDLNVTEPRPSIHADIAHSRPLPVNFGGSRKVVVYYGSNDGAFRAVEGATGKELWSFVAPEHHSKLKRPFLNEPKVAYPGLPTGIVPTPERKDYFFDGSSGLYQNGDNSQVWIYPTQRRGGRMVYAFDVSAATPALKWAKGCPNLTNDTDCVTGYSGIGQTWSSPNVAFIAGYNSGNTPVVIMGGGYDACEDTDAAATTCAATQKGSIVFAIDGDTGTSLTSNLTHADMRSVAADVTLIDRDFDGKVDHGYAADTRGNIFRIDFVDPATLTPRAPGAWTVTHIAKVSNASSRKFLFGPAALAIGNKIYLAIGSGDRERPLATNYPYVTPVVNRFYSFFDDLGASPPTTPPAIDLDGPKMQSFTGSSGCNDTIDTTNGQVGWYFDLDAGRGEQTVTSAVIFGGTIFFSTNRPTPSPPNSCGTNLGEARGYAVNLFNASGVIGSGGLCGGTRSGIFTGGGIPPSPVVGTVPVRLPDGSDKSINVLIGGIDLTTGTGSPIGAQQPPVPIRQIRSKIFWYPGGER